MAVIIPITSNLKPKPYRIIVKASEIIDNRGISDSSILVQQIRSISKARLSTFNGRLCKEKLATVALEVSKLLNINSTPP